MVERDREQRKTVETGALSQRGSKLNTNGEESSETLCASSLLRPRNLPQRESLLLECPKRPRNSAVCVNFKFDEASPPSRARRCSPFFFDHQKAVLLIFIEKHRPTLRGLRLSIRYTVSFPLFLLNCKYATSSCTRSRNCVDQWLGDLIDLQLNLLRRKLDAGQVHFYYSND